jgi:hypothetical protein
VQRPGLWVDACHRHSAWACLYRVSVIRHVRGGGGKRADALTTHALACGCCCNNELAAGSPALLARTATIKKSYCSTSPYRDETASCGQSAAIRAWGPVWSRGFLAVQKKAPSPHISSLPNDLPGGARIQPVAVGALVSADKKLVTLGHTLIQALSKEKLGSTAASAYCKPGLIPSGDQAQAHPYRGPEN